MNRLWVSAALAAFLAGSGTAANAAVYIGLQNAGANGGALTTVASGSNAAQYFNLSYGTYEVNLLTAVQGFDPVLLNSTISVHNQPGTAAGTFDLYFTVTDLSGPVPGSFFDSFTNNIIPLGWSLDVRTLVDSNNGIFSGTEIYSHTFNAIGTDVSVDDYANGLAGPYSVTHRYTLTTPDGMILGSQLLATGDTSAGAVPEPATWGLMLLGFAGLGAALRSRRHRTRLAFAG